MGATGAKGEIGATGSPGDVLRGPTGRVGAQGATGEQGETGQTGVQGKSTTGYAGAIGATGPTGRQGPTGETGAQGSTLYGPAGERGYTGTTGEQGITGVQGTKGVTTAGVAGVTGYSGATGETGATGQQGRTGSTGIINQWISYKDYDFDYNDARVRSSDRAKSDEIAKYVKANPSLQLGIDGSINPNGSDPRDQALSERRVESVRLSLINAGVPANRISIGSFGDMEERRDRRVQVLFITRS
jgi:outer membrane protein OmpA-like peptidoglycan-associated protein